ncbi:MAG: hypothetical protein ABR968_11905 [Bacteroidales bacterium]|jgi:hypothetical protein
MIIEKEIESDLEKIVEILTFSRQLAYDSYKMLMTDSDSSEMFSVIARDKFLTRVRDSFFKLAIIELTKLYGNKKNNHYSFEALFDSLKKYTDKISLEEITTLYADITNEEMFTKINNLIEIRDKHYAHTDKNPKRNLYCIKLQFKDISYLIEKAEIFINSLSIKILNKSIPFSKYDGGEMNEFFDKHLEYIKLAGLYNLSLEKRK